MLFDLKDVAGLPLRLPRENGPGRRSKVRENGDFAYFEVERYYKIMGVPVTNTHLSILDASQPQPTLNDVEQLVALTDDWNASEVPDDARRRFCANSWILGQSARRPGDISAVMTLHIESRSDRLAERMANFDEDVIAPLVHHPATTSIYGGTAHNCAVDYLLKLNCSIDDLLDFINDVHRLTFNARESVNSRTYVAVRRFADLQLGAILGVTLTRQEAEYLTSVLVPSVARYHTDLWSSLPVPAQRTALKAALWLEARIAAVRQATEGDESRFKELAKRVRLLAVCAAWQTDAPIDEREVRDTLGGAHTTLMGEIEPTLRELAAPLEGTFEDWRESVGVRKGRTFAQMAVSDLIKAVFHGIRAGIIDLEYQPHLERLQETVRVRNAITHADWAKLEVLGGLNEALKVFSTYCTVLEFLKSGRQTTESRA